MGLKNIHFDTIVELLAQTLLELGVDNTTVGEIGQLVETLRDQMVEKWKQFKFNNKPYKHTYIYIFYI